MLKAHSKNWEFFIFLEHIIGNRKFQFFGTLLRVPLLTKVFNHTTNDSLLEFLNLYWHFKRNEENKLLTFLIKARSGGNRLIASTFEKKREY